MQSTDKGTFSCRMRRRGRYIQKKRKKRSVGFGKDGPQVEPRRIFRKFWYLGETSDTTIIEMVHHSYSRGLFNLAIRGSILVQVILLPNLLCGYQDYFLFTWKERPCPRNICDSDALTAVFVARDKKWLKRDLNSGSPNSKSHASALQPHDHISSTSTVILVVPPKHSIFGKPQKVLVAAKEQNFLFGISVLYFTRKCNIMTDPQTTEAYVPLECVARRARNVRLFCEAKNKARYVRCSTVLKMTSPWLQVAKNQTLTSAMSNCGPLGPNPGATSPSQAPIIYIPYPIYPVFTGNSGASGTGTIIGSGSGTGFGTGTITGGVG